jgi:AcrR family transcriptional regulator
VSRAATGRTRGVAGPSETQQQRRVSGPQTGKGQARKAELLAAAQRVFERHGFLDARVADIVAEAEVAQGTFYSYYDSKDTIFQAVVEGVVERMLEEFSTPHEEPDATPLQRVRAGLRRYVDVYRENARIIALMEQVGTFTPEMRRTSLHIREAWLAQLERAVRRQQAEGIADPDVEPYMMIQVLGAMAEHTCYVRFTLGQPYDDEQMLDALTTAWARAFGLDRPQ